MNPTAFTFVIAMLLFKVAVIASGTVITCLGYKLFCRGIFDQEGELEAKVGDASLIMRRAAPGTIFALFGAFLVGFTAWRGMSYSSWDGIPLGSGFQVYDSGQGEVRGRGEIMYGEPPPGRGDVANPVELPSLDDHLYEPQAPAIGELPPTSP